MAKVKVDGGLYERAKKAAEAVGYSSVDEFIIHVIEKELSKIEEAQNSDDVEEQLRGLGYIE